jgi:hypothetical protein
LGDQVVEVHCRCPAELAKSRYAGRARTDEHHAVHVLPTISDDLLAEFDGPIGLGSLLPVDTTATVDVSSVAAAVIALLPGTKRFPRS